MNFNKIKIIQDKIKENRKKLIAESDPKQQQILRLKIWINQYEVKIEQLKK
jgi:hypothetical protein